MRKYVPSGKFEPIGLLIVVASGLISGYVAGSVLFWVEHLLTVSLIVVFPAVAGAIAGGLLMFAVRLGKLRNPAVAAAIAVLTALTLWLVDHHHKYQTEFVGQIQQMLIEEGKPIDQAGRLADVVLIEQTGSSGFMGFLKLETNMRTSVGSIRRPGLSLGGSNGVLMVVEFVIMTFVVAALGYSAASEAFDEGVNEWYGALKRLFSISPAQFERAFAAINRNELHVLPGLGVAEQPNGDRIDISVRRTSNPRSALLDVTHHSINEKGKPVSEKMLEGIISQAQLEQLTVDLSSAPQATVPETAAPPPARVAQPLEELPASPRQSVQGTTENGIKLGRG